MAASNATTALAVIASAAPEAASAKHLSQWRARRSNQNNIQRFVPGVPGPARPKRRNPHREGFGRKRRNVAPDPGGASSTDESHAQERDLHQDEDPTGGIRGDLVALAERR
ncbi:hypothetical protein AB1Y20_003102 [Prymnesium parvum]|uniref:Secreted protein n=1 Tax=Prymnesium parvum TaxID=97485 RepID=A0AB34JAZ8_PRYPA